jgi:hypothetical protein
VGKNYALHIKEMGGQAPKAPVLFMKPTTSYVFEGQPIRLDPKVSGVRVCVCACVCICTHQLVMGTAHTRAGLPDIARPPTSIPPSEPRPTQPLTPAAAPLPTHT